jgi:cytochrome P450
MNENTPGQMPFFNKDFEIVAQEAFGIGENLLVTDPPRHAELRNVIEPQLRAQALHDYAERCHSLIKEIFDTIPENGEVELVADVAAKIPMAVICDLMDVPEEDRQQLHIWGKMTLAATDPDSHH